MNGSRRRGVRHRLIFWGSTSRNRTKLFRTTLVCRNRLSNSTNILYFVNKEIYLQSNSFKFFIAYMVLAKLEKPKKLGKIICTSHLNWKPLFYSFQPSCVNFVLNSYIICFSIFNFCRMPAMCWKQNYSYNSKSIKVAWSWF